MADDPKRPRQRAASSHDFGRPKTNPYGVPTVPRHEFDEADDTAKIDDPDVRRMVRGKRPTDQRLEHLEEFKDDTKQHLADVREDIKELRGDVKGFDAKLDELIKKERDELKAENTARRNWWRGMLIALVTGGIGLKVLQAIGWLP